MLSIAKGRKGVAGAVKYYLENKLNYYLHGLDKEGQWHGQGAQKLGLRGMVDRQTFCNLLKGFSPDGTTKLVQNPGHQKRCCYWDLTLSAPKSVGVLWAMSPEPIRKQIERAHHEAVAEALAYAEQVGGYTRRGKGGKIIESVKLIFATVFEGSSRAQDPQPHTHCVMINVGVREDGSTGTLMTQALYDYQLAIGERYQLGFAARLYQQLRVRIELDALAFHIVGVPKTVCREFSQRRQQIEKKMKARKVEGAIAARAIALETRPKKEEIPPEFLFSHWQQRGRSLGWSTEQALTLLQEAHLRTHQKATAEDTGQRHLQAQTKRTEERQAISPAPVQASVEATTKRTRAREQRRVERAEENRAFQEVIDRILADFYIHPRSDHRTNQSFASDGTKSSETDSGPNRGEEEGQRQDRAQDAWAGREAGQGRTTADGQQAEDQHKSNQRQQEPPSSDGEQREQGGHTTEDSRARWRAQQRANKEFVRVFLKMLDRMHPERQTAWRLIRLAWWLSHYFGADEETVRDLLSQIVPGAEAPFVHWENPCLFPKAPWESLAALRTAVLRLGRPPRPWTEILWRRTIWDPELQLGPFRLFPAVELRIQQRRLFPNAPQWSPLHGVQLPALRLAKKPADLLPVMSKRHPEQQKPHRPRLTR